MKTEHVPEPEYNCYGQMQCHRCGCYSDIIYPVHCRNENGRWISLLCTECVDAWPSRNIDRVGEPLRPDRACPRYLKAVQ